MSELQHWDANAFGELTLEAVKARHQPAYKFRVQKHRYAPHTPFKGTGVGSTIYVLSGSCTITPDSSAKSYIVGAGQFLELPRGGYTMAYTEQVELIRSLHVPPEAVTANLIGLALHGNDLGAIMEMCIQATQSSEAILRGNAILGFGHLARRFGQLDRLRVEPVVLAGLTDPNEYVRGHAHSAAEDIQHFLGWQLNG